MHHNTNRVHRCQQLKIRDDYCTKFIPYNLSFALYAHSDAGNLGPRLCIAHI